MECKKEANTADCACTSESCERRGLCCECISAHLSKETLPACCFPKNPDKKFTRSFQGFAEAWGLV